MKIPVRKRGGQSASAKAEYNVARPVFLADLQEISNNIDFTVSSRGWGYYLEGENLIDKSEMNIVETLINDARKDGSLPIDFTSRDVSRKPLGIPSKDYSIDQELNYQRMQVTNFFENHYIPRLLCDMTKIYIEVIVEKVDLVGLFSPVCKQYQIPVGNLKGWSDINSRADIVKRCYDKYLEGCDVHIFYCGDFDPAGVIISKVFMKNLKDLEGGTDVDPSFINFNRFGLNHDYIIENDLIWVDNLKTGNPAKDAKSLDDPRHPDHFKPYVQNWLKEIGVRKVEANAMLKDIPAARELLLNTINTLINQDDLESYQETIEEARNEALEEFDKQWAA